MAEDLNGQAARYLEIEAKLLVEDLGPIAGRLAALGAIQRKPRVLERNVRYDDAAGSLIPAGIVLRLRQDSQIRLTYKERPAEVLAGPLVAQRFEAEVTLDDFETMALILGRLGYHPVMAYEKYRTTYELGEVEIVLDEMPYGLFVEIEGRPEPIEAAIEALGLSGCQRFRESYAQLFDRVRARLGLTFTDLTFANFAGISVPPEAFAPSED